MGEAPAAAVGPAQKVAWPAGMPEQARAAPAALSAAGGVVTAEQLSKAFKGARRDRVETLLSTLVSLGQARQVAEGRYALESREPATPESRRQARQARSRTEPPASAAHSGCGSASRTKSAQADFV